MGPERKTVISRELGLHKSAKHLQMAHNNMNHLVLRLGDFHTVMAHLSCISAYIEKRGHQILLAGHRCIRIIDSEADHCGKACEESDGNTFILLTLQSLFHLRSILRPHYGSIPIYVCSNTNFVTGVGTKRCGIPLTRLQLLCQH